MQMEESQKVRYNSSEIESPRTFLNARYIDIIKKCRKRAKLNLHLRQKLVKMYIAVIINFDIIIPDNSKSYIIQM